MDLKGALDQNPIPFYENEIEQVLDKLIIQLIYLKLALFHSHKMVSDFDLKHPSNPSYLL
jgi:hypothetical protein